MTKSLITASAFATAVSCASAQECDLSDRFDQPPVQIAVGADTLTFSAADVTGDGITDLISLQPLDSTIAVHRGLSDRSFDTPVFSSLEAPPATPDFRPFGVFAVIINGPGQAPSVIVQYINNVPGYDEPPTDPFFVPEFNLQIVRSNAIGSVATYDAGPGLDAQAIAGGADVDGDGDTDLLTFTGTQFELFRNDGTGFFDGPEQIGIPSSGFAAILNGDLNGDGNADLLPFAPLADRAYFGDGSGGFGSSAPVFLTQELIGEIPAPLSGGILLDFNADGLADIFETAFSGGFDPAGTSSLGLDVYHNITTSETGPVRFDGIFVAATPLFPAVPNTRGGSGTIGFPNADLVVLNLDDDPQLEVGQIGPSGLDLLDNSDAEGFAATVLVGPRLSVEQAASNAVFQHAFVDVDADGFTDFVFTPEGDRQTISIVFNSCDGDGGPPQECVSDTNGDGRITGSDFFAWVVAFQTGSPSCDQDGDGQCTTDDFFAWVDNFLNGTGVDCNQP